MVGWGKMSSFFPEGSGNVSLFPSNGGRNDIVHHPREPMMDWGVEYLIVFFTKSEKSSNHFFKNLWILNKDQRFKSKGMKKPAR